MRALLLVVLLALVAAGCSGDADGGSAADSLPAPLPSVQLEPLGGGEPVDLADQRGPMVINLWATWCPPCRDELPIFQEFSEKHAGRVEVLGIDYQDAQVSEAVQLAEESGVTYPLLSDLKGQLNRKSPFPSMRGLPFVAFVDAEGQVVAWEFVVIDDLAELEALVDEHLGAV